MSLLPPNASQLELAMERALAVPPVPVPLRDFVNPATCPEWLLPWLAWQLSVDEWNPAWPLATRRRVVAQSMAVHRRKGTLSAVRQAVAALGGAISIREWFETGGEAGTFSLVLALADVNGATPSAEYIDATVRQVIAAKPLSRSFDFTLAISAAGAIGVATVARAVAYARLDMAA